MAWFNKFVQGTAQGLGAGIGFGAQNWMGRREEEEREKRRLEQQKELIKFIGQQDLQSQTKDKFIASISEVLKQAPTRDEGANLILDRAKELEATLSPEEVSSFNQRVQDELVKVVSGIKGDITRGIGKIETGLRAVEQQPLSAVPEEARIQLRETGKGFSEARDTLGQLGQEKRWLPEPERAQFAEQLAPLKPSGSRLKN